jgi:hypothetical protein
MLPCCVTVVAAEKATDALASANGTSGTQPEREPVSSAAPNPSLRGLTCPSKSCRDRESRISASGRPARPIRSCCTVHSAVGWAVVTFQCTMRRRRLTASVLATVSGVRVVSPRCSTIMWRTRPLNDPEPCNSCSANALSSRRRTIDDRASSAACMGAPHPLRSRSSSSSPRQSGQGCEKTVGVPTRPSARHARSTPAAA